MSRRPAARRHPAIGGPDRGARDPDPGSGVRPLRSLPQGRPALDPADPGALRRDLDRKIRSVGVRLDGIGPQAGARGGAEGPGAGTSCRRRPPMTAGARGRVHICHIVTLLELGGAQQNTLYTVAHLDRSRYRVSLIAGKGGLLDAEALALPDVEVHLLPELVRQVDPAQDLKALARLTSLLLRLQPDVVHTHSSKAGVLGRWAAWLAGVGTVIHSIHGFGFHPGMPLLQRGFYRALEAGTAAVTTRFLAVSQSSLDAGVSQGILTSERSTLVRSGIRLAAFRGGEPPLALHRELAIPSEAPIVGMVACLKPQKAPLDYVRAAERVARRVPAAHFVLVGDGEQRALVEEESRARGLTGRMHLLGWRRDIPAILADLSLLVL